MTGSGDQPVAKAPEAPASTLPALPTMPPGIGGDTESGYSPLSLLALASLVLAAGYALSVGVGGVLALVYRGPLLLPLWTFLIPILAAVFCLLARYRIKVSEGTMSGRTLTTWGLCISLLFGLGYTAYYLATYLAVTNQAQSQAQQWLEELKTGKAEEAFWLTLPPAQRTKNRDDLEIQHNTPAGGNPGAVGQLTGFVGADFVRLMAIGGSATEIEYKGVDEWSYENNGFLVKLRYDVKTPEASFTLIVGVQGIDDRNRNKGRQWAISLTSTHLDKGLPPTYTKAGSDLVGQGKSATAFAQRLVHNVNGYGWGGAFFLSLPPGDAANDPQIPRNIVFLLGKDKWPAFLGKIDAFQKGGLVGKDSLWADPNQKKAIIDLVKDQFDPARATRQSHPIEVRPAQVPDIRRQGSDTFVHVDIRMTLDRGGLPPFVVDAQLVLKDTSVDPKNPSWYLDRIELVRGRAPEGPPRPAGPQAQGM